MIFIPIQECQLDGRDGYQFGPEGKCYTHDGTDEGRKAAKTKAEEQGRAIESSKHSDSAPSYEYLKAVYDRVMAHPSIWAQIKDKIKVAARGSAGGQLKAKYASELVKLENSAPMGQTIEENEEVIITPVVVMREGIFTGSNGIAQQKLYEEFAPSAKWLNGLPITDGHVSGMVTHRDRRLGQLFDVLARPDHKDISAKAKFYKSDLTSSELESIRTGKAFDGSIGYTCNIDTQGEQVIERGPYAFAEYAIVNKGACSVNDGCGFQMNSAPEDNGSIEKCPMKQKNEDVADIINAAFLPVLTRMDALKTRYERRDIYK